MQINPMYTKHIPALPLKSYIDQQFSLWVELHVCAFAKSITLLAWIELSMYRSYKFQMRDSEGICLYKVRA
jgi:hypothetical protein